jgi:2-dehydropantoate 2-reductase
LAEICAGAAIDAQVSADIELAMWDKFAFLCALAGTTAATPLPLGDIRRCAASWALFRRVVQEVYAVARAVGQPVVSDVAERLVAFAASLEPHLSLSLRHDLSSARGSSWRRCTARWCASASKYGVPTPTCETRYALLRIHADRAGAAEPAGHPQPRELVGGCVQ